MSTDLLTAIAALAKHGARFWSEGPAHPELPSRLERALGVSLPPSYKAFLLAFGAIAIGESTISGVLDGDPLLERRGSLFGDTQHLRTEFALPERYLVVQTDDEAPYCFDTKQQSSDGEYVVVCYELHNKYATKIASSFSEWVKNFVLPGEHEA